MKVSFVFTASMICPLWLPVWNHISRNHNCTILAPCYNLHWVCGL